MYKILLFVLLLINGLTTRAAQKIKVACIGNSITYGYALPDRDTQAYPVQLQQMLGADYVVGNFGKSGATLLNHGHRPYMQQAEYRQAIDFAGDIAVIHLGINDTDPRDWPNYRDEFVHDYLQLIDSVRAANPKVRVLICKMTPLSSRHPRFLSGTRDWHDEIQQAIETVAKYAHAELIDLFEPFHARHELLHDAIHPNAEGAQLLARTVYSAITGDFGGLKMSPLYTDNMVLQRGHHIKVNGIANAHHTVTVRLGKYLTTAVSGADGRWTALLDSLPAGGPYPLTICSEGKRLTYRNVMIGEVWLCSGQSNMEFMLRQADRGKEDIPSANDPDLRLFDMKARWRTDNVQWAESVLDSVNRLQYFRPNEWTVCTPETAANFSAIAYYFGKSLHDSLHVPVGLICNAVGGSPAEAWIDRSTLEHQFPAILNHWRSNDFIMRWVRDRANVNLGKQAPELQRHPYEPCYLFEAGILPLQHYNINGVIWYQGESNAHNKDAYARLFPLLVQSWRHYFRQNLPFYYVQLSSLDRPSWAWFRDTQRALLHEDDHMGMAVSSDCGDSLNVHPTVKRPIGERLARWALAKDYHQHLVYSGPLVSSVRHEGDAVVVSFRYGQGLKTSDAQPPRTFEVAEDEGMYHPARAEIKGDEIWLYCPQVKHPTLVRYAWQPYTRANLVNSAGLPASTFRMGVR